MKRFLCRGIFSVFVWLNYLINKRHFSSFIFNIFFLLFRISRLFSPIVGRVINELNIVNQIKWKFTQRLICIYFSLSFSFSLHPFSHTSLPLSIWLLLFLSLLTLSLFITCLDLSSHMFLYTLSQWRELCSSSCYLVLYPLSFSLHLCFRSFFLFLNLFWLNTLFPPSPVCVPFVSLFCFVLAFSLYSCHPTSLSSSFSLFVLALHLFTWFLLFLSFSLFLLLSCSLSPSLSLHHFICSCIPSFYIISFFSLFLISHFIFVMLPLSLSVLTHPLFTLFPLFFLFFNPSCIF